MNALNGPEAVRLRQLENVAKSAQRVVKHVAGKVAYRDMCGLRFGGAVPCFEDLQAALDALEAGSREIVG